MNTYLTLKDLYSYENSNITVKEIISKFCDIKCDYKLLTTLENDYFELLEIWANQNAISFEEMLDTLDYYLDSPANFKVVFVNNYDGMPCTELILGDIVICMDWDVEPDAVSV